MTSPESMLTARWCDDPGCGGLGACLRLAGLPSLLGNTEWLPAAWPDGRTERVLCREMACRPFAWDDGSPRFLPQGTELVIHAGLPQANGRRACTILYHGDRWQLLRDAPRWTPAAACGRAAAWDDDRVAA